MACVLPLRLWDKEGNSWGAAVGVAPVTWGLLVEEVVGRAEQLVDVRFTHFPWPRLACHCVSLLVPRLHRGSGLCAEHSQAGRAHAGPEQLRDLREAWREVNGISISCLHH